MESKRSPFTDAVTRAVRILFGAALIYAASAAGEPFSPSALVRTSQEEVIAIAGRTGQGVILFDTRAREAGREIQLGHDIYGLTASPTAPLLYVCLGIAPGWLAVVDLENGQIRKQVEAGHSPGASVLNADEDKLYVCNRFENTIDVYGLPQLERLHRIPVNREPISLCFSSSGEELYVGHHLPNGRSDGELVAAEVSVIDAVHDRLLHTIPLINGATTVRDIICSPDGAHIFTVHLVARFKAPTTHLDRGWVNTNGLSVISQKTRTLLHTVLLDDIAEGFPNPWALAIHPSGSTLAVSAAGGHELRWIDLKDLERKIAAATAGRPAYAPHNDLTLISKASNRVPLKGKGPRSMLFLGDRLYIGEYFSDSLGVVARKENGRGFNVESILLQPPAEEDPVRRGEFLFNDATHCYQKWLSCASCHSEDARTDGLNWDLLNDGVGNAKNVKSLLYAHRTPPTTATGVRDSAETSVRAGLRHIQFAERPEEEAQLLDAYLKSLRPLPSPHLVDGKRSASALKGEKIFRRLECNQCHAGPLFTNLKQYDRKLGRGVDTGKAFDVPSLIEAWRTAPYLHDGRAATIEEAVRLHVPDAVRPLSPEETKALMDYVLSL